MPVAIRAQGSVSGQILGIWTKVWVKLRYRGQKGGLIALLCVHLVETVLLNVLNYVIVIKQEWVNHRAKSTKFAVCATMDAHFNKMLAPTGPFPDTPAITFIASAAFAGKKEDFKFQKGSRGIGYYYDRVQVNEKKERALQEENNAKVRNTYDML